jgi:hypothetical protein
MNPHLLESLARLFRDRPHDGEEREPVAFLAVFDTDYKGDPDQKIGQALTLNEHNSTPHAIRTFLGSAGCSLEGAEANTDQRLLDIHRDETKPLHLRDRAIRARQHFLEKRYEPRIAPLVRYDAARPRRGRGGERVYFVGVTQRSPAMQRYIHAAHEAWAICEGEPFVRQTGVIRTDCVVPEETEPFVRWTLLVFRALHAAGKLRRESPVAGAELFWFPANIWTACMAALDVLSSSAGRREDNIAGPGDVGPDDPAEEVGSGSGGDRVRRRITPKNWAVATQDGKEWHVYRHHPSRRRWEQGRRLNFRGKGTKQGDLIRLFIARGGQLPLTDACALWGERLENDPSRESVRKVHTCLASEISHLSALIREAIRVGKDFQVFRKDDSDERITFVPQIPIGVALKDSGRGGDLPVWIIKPAEELSVEARLDFDPGSDHKKTRRLGR